MSYRATEGEKELCKYCGLTVWGLEVECHGLNDGVLVPVKLSSYCRKGSPRSVGCHRCFKAISVNVETGQQEITIGNNTPPLRNGWERHYLCPECNRKSNIFTMKVVLAIFMLGVIPVLLMTYQFEIRDNAGQSESVNLPELTIVISGAAGSATYSNQSFEGNVSLDGLVIKMDGDNCVYAGTASNSCVWWLGSNEPANSSNSMNNFWDSGEWVSFVYFDCPPGKAISAEVRHNGNHFPGSPAISVTSC